ncbi:hypothetical protein Tco_1227400 [Tanacetum coccineum]
MTTMAENIIAAGADNRHPMLEKSMYNSWQSRMLLYIRGKEHGKDLLDLVLHGPSQYGTVVENGITIPRTSEELTDKEKIRDECDIRATNIDRVKLLMEGTELSLQEHECKLYNESNFDQLYAYLRQHEYNPSQYQQQLSPVAQRFYSSIPQPQSYEAPVPQQPYHAFVIHSPPVFPQTNHKTSSNPRNHATIQDGRVTVQNVQGRQSQSFADNGSKSIATSSGETEVWVLMQLIRQGLFVATTVGVKVIWQDSVLNQKGRSKRRCYCDEAPSARAVLMANLSNYDSNVISEVPISDTFQDNYVLDHCVQETYYSEQPAFVHTSGIEITSDSNIISYDQYMKENKSEVVQDTTSLEHQNAMIMSVIDEMSN